MREKSFGKKLREIGKILLFVLAMIPVGLVSFLCWLGARCACAVLARKERVRREAV